MPRYALLFHDHPFPHYDLFLEEGEALRSWRLLEAPLPGRSVPAEPLPPHRKRYLDYEGPVSGGRGTVSRRGGGTYEVLEETATSLRVALYDGARSAELTLRETGDGRWTARLAGPDQGDESPSGS